MGFVQVENSGNCVNRHFHENENGNIYGSIFFFLLF